MNIQDKPDYKVFASNARDGEVLPIPNVLRGWGETILLTESIPPMEWFNWLAKRQDEWLLYLTQRGIPEWDSSLDYPKSAVVIHGDVIYISIRASKGEQPNTTQSAWSTLSAFLGLGNYYTKIESDAKYQPKGDYATNTALNNKLDKSAVVQSTGSSTTNVMSQKAVSNQLFGVGQTWQDVTGSRELDTVYTNTTGRVIQVAALINCGTTNTRVRVIVDGIPVFVQEVRGSSTSGANTTTKALGVTAVVPAGSSYQYTATTSVQGGSGEISIEHSAELR